MRILGYCDFRHDSAAPAAASLMVGEIFPALGGKPSKLRLPLSEIAVASTASEEVKKNCKKGFTLLETVVALSVIIAAVVGPVSLITRGLVNFFSAKNKVIAINLAQEGIELVRLIRENNIMCDKAADGVLDSKPKKWNEDPEGGIISKNTLYKVSADSIYAITCGVIIISTPKLSLFTSGEPLKFDSASGLYNYTSGTDTIFVREINIRTPLDASDNPDSDIPRPDQMDIVSTVSWDERGIPKNLVLKERLYNWK